MRDEIKERAHEGASFLEKHKLKVLGGIAAFIVLAGVVTALV
jgi:hypothetical protein